MLNYKDFKTFKTTKEFKQLDKELSLKKVRICTTMEGSTVFESYKYCNCNQCKDKLKNRKPVNQATITTDDLNKIDDMTAFVNNWTCTTATNTGYKKIVDISDNSKIYYYNI